MSLARPRRTAEDYVRGVLDGDRSVLAQAITLVESRKESDFLLAQEMLNELLPETDHAQRVGITGVPGVGKSTFIESLGCYLVERGHRVAVLAVDPSSTISGGSILGDKSRMSRLALQENAYIRPSPSAQSLGGVTRRTRETMLLCEAAGYDVVLVETVGVGQSETMVSRMVDFFLVLMLPGAGDELQGIKKGILEIADLIAVNKADGDNLPKAHEAKREYGAALRYLRPKSPSWSPKAMMVSGLTSEGLPELWSTVEEHRRILFETGELDRLRQEQRRSWMWDIIEERLLDRFRAHAGVRSKVTEWEAAVVNGEATPTSAAVELLETFGEHVGGDD